MKSDPFGLEIRVRGVDGFREMMFGSILAGMDAAEIQAR